MGHNGSYWEWNFYGNIEDENDDEDEGGAVIWAN
jgi:hypothetical protein